MCYFLTRKVNRIIPDKLLHDLIFFSLEKKISNIWITFLCSRKNLLNLQHNTSQSSSLLLKILYLHIYYNFEPLIIVRIFKKKNSTIFFFFNDWLSILPNIAFHWPRLVTRFVAIIAFHPFLWSLFKTATLSIVLLPSTERRGQSVINFNSQRLVIFRRGCLYFMFKKLFWN